MSESCLIQLVLDKNHSFLGTVTVNSFEKGSVLIQKVHDITRPLCFANIPMEDKFRVSTGDNNSAYSTFIFNRLCLYKTKSNKSKGIFALQFD